MLAKLRQKIDAIDDAMIALLIERAQIVEEVGALKSHSSDSVSFIRPGREATMLRRLMEKTNNAFPKAAIAAMWRIIIGASLNIEQKLQVSVHIHEGDTTPYWYSREYFGAFTQLTTYRTSAQVISDLSQDKANVGVLFLPLGVDSDTWWCNFNPAQHNMYIFAFIPFVQPSLEKNQTEIPKLIALAKAMPEETGDDKTVLVLNVSADISQTKIIKLFEQHGFQTEYLASIQPKNAPEKKYYLIEIAGFLMNEQVAIEQMVQTIDSTASVTLLGSYAVPIEV